MELPDKNGRNTYMKLGPDDTFWEDFMANWFHKAWRKYALQAVEYRPAGEVRVENKPSASIIDISAAAFTCCIAAVGVPGANIVVKSAVGAKAY